MSDMREGPDENPIMQWFTFTHLSYDKGRYMSELVHNLAVEMNGYLDDGPEKSAGLRKLLEAKDCFVRAGIMTSMEDANNQERSE